MDFMLQALLYYKSDKFLECIKACEKVLEKNEYDQAAWLLKMEALTEMIYVDDLEVDQSGIAETILDDNVISTLIKPGTSFQGNRQASDSLSMATRPSSQAGVPNTGYIRPSNNADKNLSLEQTIRTSRSAHTARPVSAASGRFVRLGTASMLSNQDGVFINISRLNFHKYAERSSLSKSLFEYILYHENDLRHAMELAILSTEACEFNDWWWKLQLGKCYFRLGLYRDAEQQIRSVLTHQPVLDGYLWLCKIFVKLDQPLAALEICESGLEKFPSDVSLLVFKARIFEDLNEKEKCKEMYKQILNEDNMNVEVIACIGNNYFYEDQPEMALNFYRRLFQMGIQTVELLNNLALCCFYSQQFDMCISCFHKALTLAIGKGDGSDSCIADVYYNIGVVALSLGDNNLGYQNFRLALAHENDHGESYNNLGVLEMHKGNVDMARAFLQAADSINPRLFESQYNFGLLAERIGDLPSSYVAIRKALNIFPAHFDGNDLMKSLSDLFSSV